jgi:hypothetical protein
MRIVRKTDAPQVVKIVEFFIHMMIRSVWRAARDVTKILSDNASLATSVFVEIYMIRCLEHIYTKVGQGFIEAELRKDIVA